MTWMRLRGLFALAALLSVASPAHAGFGVGQSVGFNAPWQASVPIAGDYWMPLGIPTAAGTTNHNNNRLYAVFFYSQQGGILESIGLGIVTGQAASTARIGIYTLDSTGYPADLVSGSDGGDIDTSASGVVAAASGLSVYLSPNTWYATAVNISDTALNIRQAGVTPIATAFRSDSSGAPAFGVTVASVYGPMPATFPAGATNSTSTSTTWAPYFLFSRVP